jgi:hypothetical protein
MVIIQALIAALARSSGRLLNTAFGWATTLLFGKVPAHRQVYLSVLAFGSVIWLLVILGIAFPAFAAWMLTLAPLPEWVDDRWIRLAFLVAALVVPLVIGGVSIFILDPSERPQGVVGTAQAVVKGYPSSLGLALTLVLMTIFAPVLKARALIKRWTNQHVPVIVEPPHYEAVVRDIQLALGQGGLQTERRLATWMLRAPSKLLTLLAGGAVESLVAERLTTLTSPKVEILLHPSDLVISGREMDVARTHAIITEQLTFAQAYMTWTREGNELEDRLRTVWEQLRTQPARSAPAGPRPDGRAGDGQDGRKCPKRDGHTPDPPDLLERLRAIERDLRKVEVSYEEWEVLFRKKLMVERGVLQMYAGLLERPPEPAEAPAEALNTTTQLAQTQSGPIALVEQAAGRRRGRRRGLATLSMRLPASDGMYIAAATTAAIVGAALLGWRTAAAEDHARPSHNGPALRPHRA